MFIGSLIFKVPRPFIVSQFICLPHDMGNVELILATNLKYIHIYIYIYIYCNWHLIRLRDTPTRLQDIVHGLIRDIFLLMKDREKKMDMSLRFRVFIHYIYVVTTICTYNG